MAINKKLIHFNHGTDFDAAVDTNQILDTSIVFIKDRQQIYTHGETYNCESVGNKALIYRFNNWDEFNQYASVHSEFHPYELIHVKNSDGKYDEYTFFQDFTYTDEITEENKYDYLTVYPSYVGNLRIDVDRDDVSIILPSTVEWFTKVAQPNAVTVETFMSLVPTVISVETYCFYGYFTWPHGWWGVYYIDESVAERHNLFFNWDGSKFVKNNKYCGTSPQTWLIYAEKGKKNGIATLGTDGKVPASQLPELEAGLELGEIEGTAYEGSKGKANADSIAEILSNLELKADKENTYTKTEVDNAIAGVDVSAQLNNYLTKTEAEDTYVSYGDGLDLALYDMSGNPDTSFGSTVADVNDLKDSIKNVYTKTESDDKYQAKGNYLTEHQDISGKANVGDSYTKAESDAKYLTEHLDISGKVDKVDGKQLSTNDFTTEEKTKLLNLEEYPVLYFGLNVTDEQLAHNLSLTIDQGAIVKIVNVDESEKCWYGIYLDKYIYSPTSNQLGSLDNYNLDRGGHLNKYSITYHNVIMRDIPLVGIPMTMGNKDVMLRSASYVRNNGFFPKFFYLCDDTELNATLISMNETAHTDLRNEKCNNAIVKLIPRSSSFNIINAIYNYETDSFLILDESKYYVIKYDEGKIVITRDTKKASWNLVPTPETLTESLILMAQRGNIKWGLFGDLKGMEELLAYGVEWDTTVSDSQLTRIGNMTLHKTLPILSQLKGCIAYEGHILYFLEEEDWYYKAGYNSPQSLRTSSLINLFSEVNGDKFLIDNPLNHSGINMEYALLFYNDLLSLTNIGNRITILIMGENYHYDISVSNSVITLTEIEKGGASTLMREFDEGPVIVRAGQKSNLDGRDGVVQVYCPAFYIKSELIENKCRVWISTVKIDESWTFLPELLIDAYKSTVIRQQPSSSAGYLSIIPVGSAVSIANTNTYCRGGNNTTEYDLNINNPDTSTANRFRSNLGKPATYLSREEMRNSARLIPNTLLLSYDLYKNIFYWLYVIEYANFNCLETYTDTLTTEGYHLGGLGTGVAIWSQDRWMSFNNNNPITPCGYGDSLGNKTGVKLMRVIDNTGSTDYYVPRWRGFDNPFGDIWTVLDGVLVTKSGDLNNVYVWDDPNRYSDTSTSYSRLAGSCPRQKGYIKRFSLGSAADIVPTELGATATTYMCDESHWSNSNITKAGLFVGGLAYNVINAGIGCFNHNEEPSWKARTAGFRTVSSPVTRPLLTI